MKLGIQDLVFRITTVTILFFGAMGPVFRDDPVSKYIGAACVTILTAYTAVHIMRRNYLDTR